MKIIGDLINKDSIDDLQLCDEIVIPTKYSNMYSFYLDNNEIKDKIEWCIINNKKAILKIDCIIEENKIDELYEFLDEYYNLDISFMFSDMAILLYFKKKKMNYKLIYNSPTYMCNYDECLFYKNQGIKVVISNELSIDDVIRCSSLDNVIIQTYGYYPIYYSKRKVMSLYSEHIGKKFIDENNCINNLLINEETRKEKYNIIEYNDHTLILSAYRILIYKELEKILPSNIYLNGFKLSIEDYKLIIELFKDYNINNYNKIKEIDKGVDSSLLYSVPSIL